MIDHHVDRPGVEVQQCTKLTGPNRPTGSISSHHTQHAAVRSQPGWATHRTRHVAHQRTRNLAPGPDPGAVTPTKGCRSRRPADGLDDLVAMAGSPHPIPSRTRP